MNIKRTFKQIALSIFLLPSTVMAQQYLESPELVQIIKSAGEFLNKGDFNNAVSMYKQAIRMAPDNIALRKDLAYTYLLQKNLTEARTIINQVLASSVADAQSYQIAAGIETADGKNAKAKKILNEGLSKFPNAGVLYNSKGNILSTESKSNKPALKEWLTGIAIDPFFATNYFNAAKSLFQNKDYVWAIVYAEKFINLEPETQKTIDMKKLLFDAYQKIFTLNVKESIPDFNAKEDKSKFEKMDFEQAFLKAINVNISTVSEGFSVENLSMLRSRFLIYWNANFAQRFPQSIINYQTKILKENNYTAYNQWLFGANANSAEFSAWVNQFSNAYQSFGNWQKNNPYQPSLGDASINIK